MGKVWEAMVPPSLFGRKDKTGVSAKEHRVRMANGRDYLCATSGLWNANLGYGNDAITSAISRALDEAPYLTLFRYSNEYAESAAENLITAARADAYQRVIFSTSGAAANDLVLKLGRQYQVLSDGPRDGLVVSMTGSYHGLTYGGMSVSGDTLEQQMYGVDRRAIRTVSPTDPAELRDLIDQAGEALAQIVMEPVMGAGAVEIAREVVELAFEARRRFGTLVVADEVASGFGRTGRMFASEAWPEVPDVLIASKGLTNGTCAAAVVMVGQRICRVFDDADAMFLHGETQAGTPPTCAAIDATLAEFDRVNALALARGLSSELESMLEDLQDAPGVSGHRGVGCFRALELRDAVGEKLNSAEVRRVVDAVREAGALVHPSASSVLLMPSLTYTREDVAELRDALHAGLVASR